MRKLLLSLLFVLGSSLAASAQSIVDSYVEANRDDANGLGDALDHIGQGQAFTGTAVRITSARFFLAKSGLPTGNAVAKLYAISGAFGSTAIPTGAALATSDNFNVTMVGTFPTFTLFEITFTGANQFQMVAGTNYAITLEYNGGDASNQLLVGVDASSSTHSGNNVRLDGSTWSPHVEDTIFYVLGTLAVTGPKTGSLGMSGIGR
jgi:hypothetical protein